MSNTNNQKSTPTTEQITEMLAKALGISAEQIQVKAVDLSDEMKQEEKTNKHPLSGLIEALSGLQADIQKTIEEDLKEDSKAKPRLPFNIQNAPLHPALRGLTQDECEQIIAGSDYILSESYGGEENVPEDKSAVGLLNAALILIEMTQRAKAAEAKKGK